MFLYIINISEILNLLCSHYYFSCNCDGLYLSLRGFYPECSVCVKLSVFVSLPAVFHREIWEESVNCDESSFLWIVLANKRSFMLLFGDFFFLYSNFLFL